MIHLWKPIQPNSRTNFKASRKNSVLKMVIFLKFQLGKSVILGAICKWVDSFQFKNEPNCENQHFPQLN